MEHWEILQVAGALALSFAVAGSLNYIKNALKQYQRSQLRR